MSINYRLIQDLKTRELAMSDTNFYPSAQGPVHQNFMTHKDRTIARPTTAPEQKQSFSMKSNRFVSIVKLTL